MSNITPLKQEEALAKILPYYQPILNVIYEEYIMSGEQVLFAADATRHEINDEEGTSLWKTLAGDYNTTTHKDIVVNQASLLVVTSSRWIRWSLGQFTMNYSIKMQKEGEFMDRLFSGNHLKFEWVTPPVNFPHDWLSKQKKQVREFVTENISIVKLKEIEVSTREEFTLKNKHTTPESELHLLRFPVGEEVFYSFKYDDGVYLHKLIQAASINRGVIPIETNDSMKQLKQLKEMLDNDLISQQEYDHKKAEILSRM